MDAENLGRMFAPSIIRHATNTMDVVAAQVEAVIVSYFILNVMAFSNRRGTDTSGTGTGTGNGGKEEEKEEVKDEEVKEIDFGEDDELETSRGKGEEE